MYTKFVLFLLFILFPIHVFCGNIGQWEVGGVNGTLSWDAPSYIENIDGYTIYYESGKNDIPSSPESINAGNATNCSISLDESGWWTMWGTSYNATAESDYSVPLHFFLRKGTDQVILFSVGKSKINSDGTSSITW